MKYFWRYYIAIFVVILLDQGLKLYAHFTIYVGGTPDIKLLGNFLKLTYILNPGMAFGINLGFKYGKLVLTIIRIIASGLILRYIVQLIYNKESVVWWIWGWVLILGGAMGNSIDSIFYGILFKNAPSSAPMQWGYGQVIDMVHLDIWSGILPLWVPFWGGQCIYCLPIFNLADVAIFLGLIMILAIKEPSHAVADPATLAENGNSKPADIKLS